MPQADFNSADLSNKDVKQYEINVVTFMYLPLWILTTVNSVVLKCQLEYTDLKKKKFE